MAKDWKDFDRFVETIDKYMPSYGEGKTVASQACTAVNKLIYKWFNDGDVYDNTGSMEGWCNDLSDYANWLAEHIDGAEEILRKIFQCYSGGEYEDLLYELAETVLNNEILTDLDMIPAMGSIYDCKGFFEFVEYDDDDEDDEW